MKTKHVFWGLFFISLGLLILLNNLGSLDWDWYGLWKLWPAIFIVWGISILIKTNIVRTILTGIVAIILAVAVFASVKSFFVLVQNHFKFSPGDDFGIIFDGDYDTTSYQVSLDKGIQNAELNFKAGAGHFKTADTTSQLFYTRVIGQKDNYSLKESEVDGRSIIKMDMKKKEFLFTHGKNRNKVKFYFNENPLWDMDYSIGAASVDFDLRNYKIERINFDMGAASLKLWLGGKTERTDVKIEAGASSIRIYIPDSSGCQINSDVTLSSKRFEGFEKIDSGLYRTYNFDQAKNKIYIKMDIGVSSIRVEKY